MGGQRARTGPPRFLVQYQGVGEEVGENDHDRFGARQSQRDTQHAQRPIVTPWTAARAMVREQGEQREERSE